MLCPTAGKNCCIVRRPSAYSAQRRLRRSWRVRVDLDFVGGCKFPTACCIIVVAASAVSVCSASSSNHTVGWWWATRWRRRLFQPSDTLFVRCPPTNVMSWTFQDGGGNLGGVALVRARPLTVRGRVLLLNVVFVKIVDESDCFSRRLASQPR